jgi:hypothetical protein
VVVGRGPDVRTAYLADLRRCVTSPALKGELVLGITVGIARWAPSAP